MVCRAFRALLGAALLIAATPGRPTQADAPPATMPREARLSHAPMAFEQNLGQFDPAVRFASRGPGYTLFLTDREAVVALNATSSSPRSDADDASVVRLSLENANGQMVMGVARLPGVVNYLIGNDPARWRTGVPLFDSVRYAGVYRDVDLVYYGRDGRHEYDFEIAPGGDASAIALRVRGATRLGLDRSGDLQLETAAGTLTMKAPVVYQMVNGERQPVEARYTMPGPDVVRFDIGAYDVERPLVIDPQLVYGTYLGGTGNGLDQARAVALDETGAAYIIGTSETTDFPTEAALQGQRRGQSDAVVTKLAPDGQRLMYSTYLGGTSFDTGTDIVVRSDGIAYVLGDTSSADFPVRDAFEARYRGNSDAFVVQIAADGRSIEKGTYLGGGTTEVAGGLRLSQFKPSATAGTPPPDAPTSPLGDWLFVYGSTTSPDFPTVRPAQAHRAGERDGFLTVFDRQTLQPRYSTYAGGDGADQASALVLNRRSGDLYLWLKRPDNPPVIALFKPTVTADTAARSRPFSGLADLWGLTILQVEQYIEERDADREAALAKLKDGEVVPCAPEPQEFFQGTVVAEQDVFCKAATFGEPSPVNSPSAEGDHPLREAVFMLVMPGCLLVPPARTCTSRAVAVFFDADVRVISHLNFGGTRVGREFLPATAVADGRGVLHFIGRTTDSTLPVHNPIQSANRGSAEGFVLTLDPITGETSFLSYLGGSSFDTLTDIAVDKDGNRWIVGETQSADFPTTRSGVQPNQRGRIDAFVVKIEP